MARGQYLYRRRTVRLLQYAARLREPPARGARRHRDPARVGGRTFGDMGVSFATRIGISTGHVIGGSVGAGRR